jgi:hypothetical protein
VLEDERVQIVEKISVSKWKVRQERAKALTCEAIVMPILQNVRLPHRFRLLYILEAFLHSCYTV